MVFYRKYRPQKLSEMAGQESIRKTLTAQLATGKISHAYLFAGPKGTGKTTTARILAKAVNCKKVDSRKKSVNLPVGKAGREPASENFVFQEPCDNCDSCLAVVEGRHLDLIEIDAASNRGIDEIRDLREKIKLAPVAGRYKVYILDESHMLTAEAANALLKTLEEPPAHAIFVLATTQPEKLPSTIVSRCTRFDFAPATVEEIITALEKIARKEKIGVENKILELIAANSDGSFRDAVNIFDQLAVQDKLVLTEVEQFLSVGPTAVAEFVQNLFAKNPTAAVLQINSLAEKGVNLQLFIKETLNFLRKLLFLKAGLAIEAKNDLTAQDLKKLERLKTVDQTQVLRLAKLISEAERQMRFSPIIQLPLELAVLEFTQSPPPKAVDPEDSGSLAEIVSEIFD